MSVVREEVAVLSHEIPAAGRAAAVEAVKATEMEALNPLALKQAAEVSAKESMSKGMYGQFNLHPTS